MWEDILTPANMKNSALRRELQKNNATSNASTTEYYFPSEDKEWRKHVAGDGFYRGGQERKKAAANKNNARRAFRVPGEPAFKGYAGEGAGAAATLGPTVRHSDAPVCLSSYSLCCLHL